MTVLVMERPKTTRGSSRVAHTAKLLAMIAGAWIGALLLGCAAWDLLRLSIRLGLWLSGGAA